MASLDDLLRELNNPDPKRRQETIRALARLRQVGAVDALRRVAAHDPDDNVRALAAGAVEFLEREKIEAALRRPRRRATETPDLSESALREKEQTVRARQLSTAEYILIGALATLGAALFILLIAGGLGNLLGRVFGEPPPPSREGVVAAMILLIDEARAFAGQMREALVLTGTTPDGVACETLPAIPATYRLPERERELYPELRVAEGALHQARISLHDVEARIRRQCNAEGRLTEMPAPLIAQAEASIQAGLAELDNAEAALSQLPPVATPSLTVVSQAVVY